jgi:hypothetical protein
MESLEGEEEGAWQDGLCPAAKQALIVLMVAIYIVQQSLCVVSYAYENNMLMI